MAYSTQSAVSDGTLSVLPLSIDYLSRDDITVYLGSAQAPVGSWAWVGTIDRSIKFTPAVPKDTVVTIKRSTGVTGLYHKFSGGAQFTSQTLDESLTQTLFVAQEFSESSSVASDDLPLPVGSQASAGKSNKYARTDHVHVGMTGGSVGSVVQDNFVGDGVKLAFTLQNTPATKGSTQVYIDSVYQSKAAYALAGPTITFDEAPTVGAVVEVITVTIGGGKASDIQLNETPEMLATDTGGNVQGALAWLSKFLQGGTGAVSRKIRDKLRERVSVGDFGAKGDGATDDAPAFSAAAAYAASIGAHVRVNAPLVSYKLATDPVIPSNMGISASPDWFTGAGRLPFHKFVALSEGVDPRVFSIKGMFYSESQANETKRKWGAVGWVNIKDAPAAGSEGTTTDAVGMDGRGRAAAPHARVWGVVGLGQLDAGVSGLAQAYAAEFDINNNNANCTQDGPLAAKGVVMASGGNFRAEVAHFVIATKTPANTLGDNRFLHGLRFYRDSCYEANIYIDDANACDAMRIPNTSRGVHWTSNANLVNYYMRVSAGNNHLELTIDQNQFFDVLNSAGQKVVSFGESSVDYSKPIGYSGNTYFNTIPTSINVGIGDLLIFGVAGTVTGGLTGGSGNRITTIVNASGGVVTINRNTNMRTAAGAAVVLNNLQAVQFAYSGGTYFQVSAPVANG